MLHFPFRYVTHVIYYSSFSDSFFFTLKCSLMQDSAMGDPTSFWEFLP